MHQGQKNQKRTEFSSSGGSPGKSWIIEAQRFVRKPDDVRRKGTTRGKEERKTSGSVPGDKEETCFQEQWEKKLFLLIQRNIWKESNAKGNLAILQGEMLPLKGGIDECEVIGIHISKEEQEDIRHAFYIERECQRQIAKEGRRSR